jgi:hypothetical protein
LLPPASIYEYDSCVHAHQSVLVETGSQIRGFLRLKQIVKDTHLRLVIGAASNLFRAVIAQLAVIGPAITITVESRLDSRCLAVLLIAGFSVRYQIGLAFVTSRSS